ncbi:hypothetical protein HpVa49_13280 [Helicobacter pylori]
MLYPFLKIPLHYSASDRARKVRNENLKIKKRFEKSVKNQQKEKDQTLPHKKESSKKALKKREFKKRGFKKKEFQKRKT